MDVVLPAVAAVVAAGWVPVFVHFFRNWRRRANPTSLAICCLVAFAMYLCGVPFLGRNSDPGSVFLVLLLVNGITCLFFYVSFQWSKKRWQPKDGRPRADDE